jgi:hypothetical protein
MKKIFILLLLIICCLATLVNAQEKGEQQEKSVDEVARELANPNGSLATLRFKNQFRWYKGDLNNADDQSNYTLLFQPVFPFIMKPPARGGKANFFVRPAIPIMFDQPVFDVRKADFDEVNAMGDIGFDVAYGVTEKNGLLWALGMVGTLPTATDSDVAGKQWRLGPEALRAKFEKWGLYGIFPSHQWNVTGWDDESYSNTQIQLFYKYLPGGGWSIGSTPIMDYNWETSDWTIPLQMIVSRTVMAGKMPVKLEAELNYYVAQPDPFGPEWMLGINIGPVVPNIFDRWIKSRVSKN